MQVRPLAPDEATGISITFRPDYTILESNTFIHADLAKRFQEISYLVKGLTITLTDERISPLIETDFHSEAGLLDYIAQMNADVVTLHEPIFSTCVVVVPRQHSDPYRIEVEFAFQFTDTMERTVLSFVNTIKTSGSGIHIRALLSAITNDINERACDRMEDDSVEYSPLETPRGLTAVIHILHPFPSYKSQTNIKPILPAELYGAVSEAVFRACNNLLKDSTIAKKVIEKCERLSKKPSP